MKAEKVELLPSKAPCSKRFEETLILQESFRGQPATLDGLARTLALYNAGSPNWSTALSYAAQLIAKAPALDTTPATSLEPASRINSPPVAA